MTPNITHHNPAPDYLRGLTLYISAEDAPGHLPVPYCVQFALECLAKEVSA